MKVSRRSILSGEIVTMDLDVTQEELDRFAAGEFAQRVWPHLSPGIREFLINGITPQEWEEQFGNIEE